MPRPTLEGEPMVAVNIRLTPKQIARLDERVSEMGLDRSRYIRALIYADLAQRDAELAARHRSARARKERSSK